MVPPGFHSSFVIRHLKEDADARFIDQPVARLGHAQTKSEIPHDILSQLEIAAGIKLVDLLAGRKRVERRARASVVLQAEIELPVHFVADANPGLEIPAFCSTGPAQRAADHRVEIELKASDIFLQNRTDLERRRVLLVRTARKSDFAGNAYLHREIPGLR